MHAHSAQLLYLTFLIC